MKMVALALGVSLAVGFVTGGSLRGLGQIRLRWPYLAIVGIVLQLFPLGGWQEDALVLGSFGALLVFALANIREPGFVLLAAGVALNLVVIVANQGMPVSRTALLRSDQQETYTFLIDSAGAKHHVATAQDVLRPLGDVIPIPAPIAQAVSIGDVLMWAGAGWFLVVSMRRQTDLETAPVPTIQSLS